MSKKKKIYLDYASTTPVEKQVLKVMSPFWSENFGNSSSLHSMGLVAQKAIKNSREKIAKILNSRNEEIYFTAGGTESANLAIFGVVRGFPKGSHIITTQIEHEAVLKPFEQLKKEGYEVTFLPVGLDGKLKLTDLENSIKANTVFVSVMYANNEIGTIQPIQEVGKLINFLNKERPQEKQIVFHSDACQAAGALDLNTKVLGVSLLTLNASKIYGPKQVGCLFVKQGVKISPYIFGGGQEQDLRSGTENVPGIVGFAEALQISESKRQLESKRLFELQQYFIRVIKKQIQGVFFNATYDVNKKYINNNRLSSNLNLRFENVNSEVLSLYLDSYGIQVSTKSACANNTNEESHVLRAIGLTDKQSKESFRISLGRFTKKGDIDYLVKTLVGLVKMLRCTKTFN